MATNCINTININSDHLIHDIIKWKDLYKIDFLTSAPFKLTLDDSNTLLSCEKIVRVIPGKRLVAYSTWNNKPVVAKLFYSPNNAHRHFNEEITGSKILIDSCIPTPELLWQGTCQKKQIYVLIFERIVDAINLNALWQKKSSYEELTPLLRSVTVELATQHVLGIVQHDLHMKNFLITEKNIYSIDGSSIVQLNGILPKQQSLDHLALFFAQLGIGTEKLQQELFQTYTKARGWIIKKSDIAFFHQTKTAWLKKRWLRFKKKIQRNSTLFSRQKTARSVIQYDNSFQSHEFLQFLQNPESMFSTINSNRHCEEGEAVLTKQSKESSRLPRLSASQPRNDETKQFQQKDIQILKAGNSSTVIKVKINNNWLIIKRYNIKNVWHRLRRCLRETRAATSWKLAQRLHLFGISTAKPVAFIENRFLGFRGTSYFIMEYINAPHVGDYFNDTEITQPLKLKTAEHIIDLLINLKKMQLIHGDLKMTNILIENQSPILIDLDSMKQYHRVFNKRQLFHKEIQRFMKNWKNQPTIHELFQHQLKTKGIIKN